MDCIAHYKYKSGYKYFFNLMPFDNIESVMEFGILSHNQAQKKRHKTMADEDVQNIRDGKRVPNALPLHDYANLYLDARNPMMFKRKAFSEKFILLVVSLNVLRIKGVVVSDGNAAAEMTAFGPPEIMIGKDRLEYDKIFMRHWPVADDIRETRENKRKKCAEVLVPHKIDYDNILGAIVVNKQVENDLKQKGFLKKIVINPDLFFK